MTTIGVLTLTSIIQNSYLFVGIFIDLVVYRDKSKSFLQDGKDYFLTRKVAEEFIYATFYTIFGGLLVSLWKLYWKSNELGFVIIDVTKLSPIIKYLLLIILVDFVYYIAHRLSHAINILWAGHKFHHTVKSFHSAFVSLSLSPEIAFYLFQPLYLCSLVFRLKKLSSVPHLSWDGTFSYIPSASRSKTGCWSESWLHHPITESITRSKMKYADKNFAVMFILWDVIFGTFKEEGDDVRIGLFGMRARKTYIARYFTGYIDIWEDFVRVKGFKDKLRVLTSTPLSVKKLIDEKY